jgi:hypothetical protein
MCGKHIDQKSIQSQTTLPSLQFSDFYVTFSMDDIRQKIQCN